MGVLNTKPEILLKKRKNRDQQRLERKNFRFKPLNLNKKIDKKFVRLETLLSNSIANKIEKKRLKGLQTKYKKTKNISSDEPSKFKLLFAIRVPNYKKGLSLAPKCLKILKSLKLLKVNSGVFIKADAKMLELLSLIAPFIIIGRPSLQNVRDLFFKRAAILCPVETDSKDSKDNAKVEKKKYRVKKLDSNELVEEKFQDLDIICIEDLVHEIWNLTDNFDSIVSWLLPFKLNSLFNGWGPEETVKRHFSKINNQPKINLSYDFKIREVPNINEIIQNQN